MEPCSPWAESPSPTPRPWALQGQAGADVIADRVWGAEAGVLLPLIERRHRAILPRICRFLPSLPPGTDGILAATGMTLGEICHDLEGQPLAPPLRDEITRLGDLRNALAHCHMVHGSGASAPELYG